MPSTRRSFLACVATGSATLAGCSRNSSSPNPDVPPAAGVDVLSTPDRNVSGANGDWSSFGCNAANTREVADGEAPVDGVTERWRVEVGGLSLQAPVVVGDRVYQPDGRELRVFDAADGTELWSHEEVVAAPLVRDGVAYVSSTNTVDALDAETGETLWTRTFDAPGRVTSPATYAGRELICAAGEHVFAIDPGDGAIVWQRDVFGQVLDHVAFFGGLMPVVVTEAGMVYLLVDGTGVWRWQLPAAPAGPPSAGSDSVYVNCRDGKTYALMSEARRSAAFHWTADIGGWAERGMAVVDDLVLVPGGRNLHAIDAKSGRRHWRYAIGDWQHTAPAFGRDTVFVGGDRLRAIDPTPGGSPVDGPALRFEREFAGRVGPGPVLNDGSLYVIAEVEAETYALLALE